MGQWRAMPLAALCHLKMEPTFVYPRSGDKRIFQMEAPAVLPCWTLIKTCLKGKCPHIIFSLSMMSSERLNKQTIQASIGKRDAEKNLHLEAPFASAKHVLGFNVTANSAKPMLSSQGLARKCTCHLHKSISSCTLVNLYIAAERDLVTFLLSIIPSQRA